MAKILSRISERATRSCLPFTMALSLFLHAASGAVAFPPLPPRTFRELLEDHDAIVVIQLKTGTLDRKTLERDAFLVKVISYRDRMRPGVQPQPMDLPFRGQQPLQPRTLMVFGQRNVTGWDWYCGIAHDQQAELCIKGLLNPEMKDNQKLLRFLFDYLKSSNREIAERAFGEWAQSDAADFGRVAKLLSPTKVRALVGDAELPRPLRHLACFMLGHCGDDTDTAAIRQLIETEREPGRHSPRSYREFSLKGLVLVNGLEGWAFVRSLLTNPRQPFTLRYNCLNAVRYFHDDSRKIPSKREIEQVLAETLNQEDLADFVIDDFRRWKCWEHTDRVLALFASQSSDDAIKRAVIRYTLRCPEPSCARLVEEQRRNNPKSVDDAEEYLRQERAP
jgi:hypothetical protein